MAAANLKREVKKEMKKEQAIIVKVFVLSSTSIDMVLAPVKTFNPPLTGSADTDQLLKELKLGAQIIDREGVKLALNFFNDPVRLEACQPMAQKYVESIAFFAHRFLQLHFEKLGKTLYGNLQQGAINVIKAAKHFSDSLVATQGKAMTSDSGWIGAGDLDEACKKFDALPNTNREAVCKSMNGQLAILKDGFAELAEEVEWCKKALALDVLEKEQEQLGGSKNTSTEEEEVEKEQFKDEDNEGEDEDDDVDSPWSQKDLDLLPNVLGLIKVSQNILNKFSSQLSKSKQTLDAAQIAVDDSITLSCATLTANVDDLILESYGEIHGLSLLPVAQAVRDRNLALLQLAKQQLVVAEGDAEPAWLEMLQRAAHHNYNKLDTTITTQLTGTQ